MDDLTGRGAALTAPRAPVGHQLVLGCPIATSRVTVTSPARSKDVSTSRTGSPGSPADDLLADFSDNLANSRRPLSPSAASKSSVALAVSRVSVLPLPLTPPSPFYGMRVEQLLLQPRLQDRAFYREQYMECLRRSENEPTLHGRPSLVVDDKAHSTVEINQGSRGPGPCLDLEKDGVRRNEGESPPPSPSPSPSLSQPKPVKGEDVRPSLGPSGEYFLVDWEPGERSNPHNWSAGQKWLMTLFVGLLATIVGMASSVNSPGAKYVAQRFHVGIEVAELQTALYLVGFGVSAPLFGPLSEVAGRVPVYAFTLLVFAFFEMGAALAQNIQTRVILKFWAGFWGSAPLSNAGGSVADMVNPRSRTIYFSAFALSGLLGPALGAVIGGYLAMKAGQQWCDWVMAILSFAVTGALVLFMRETYSPILLKYKAQALRNVSGDSRYMTALERERMDIPFAKSFKTAMFKPIAYLVYEPIVMAFSIAITLIYLIFFGFLEGLSITFEGWHMNPGKIGLLFLSLAVGLLGVLLPLPWLYKRYVRRENEAQEQLAELRAKGIPEEDISPLAGFPPPEERLVYAMFGTWFLVIGLFWQGWTSIISPQGSPWPAIAALVFIGVGVLSWFISTYQYIIDVYGTGSASALSTTTMARYLVAGGATLFSRPMYRNLHPQWALTLLGCLTFVFSFIPFGFYTWGPQIRSWSRYART